MLQNIKVLSWSAHAFISYSYLTTTQLQLDEVNHHNHIMLSKYIELNHKLENGEVMINRQKESISKFLQKIGELKSEEAAVENTVYPNCNWGFLNTILTCYNNQWVLKTTPEDWWDIILYTVAKAIEQKSEVSSIRKFIVSHEGKKKIKIIVETFKDIDYSWLLTQLIAVITPYTTSSQQLTTNQIMVMTSVAATHCGIPGIEMRGSVKDWEKLVTKAEGLRKIIEPIIEDLELTVWFSETKRILDKLLETYNGVPDRKWWSQILSYNSSDDGSDQKGWWSGWMAEFLRPDTDRPVDFTSGVVSVPLVLIGGRYEDTGNLVAGTVGYTIEESTYNRPSIKTEHGWGLILPKDSPLTPIIVGEKKN